VCRDVADGVTSSFSEDLATFSSLRLPETRYSLKKAHYFLKIESRALIELFTNG
jgi:hypothetical protein